MDTQKEQHFQKSLYKGNRELIEESIQLQSEVEAEDLKKLKEHFGYTTFRPLQWNIIHATMNCKRDVCAILTPGYGRSLCYQYPAVCTNATVLVISPLSSKIKEEVCSMIISNVSVLHLNSCDCNKNDLKKKYSLIYIDPKVFSSYKDSFLKDINFSLIVLDEAQCVSSWGPNYCVVYKELEKVRDVFPGTPILALTSSPCPQVRDDIISNFKMDNPLIICSSFDRKNLKFEVLISMETSIKVCLERLHINPADWNSLFNESTVIYVDTSAKAEAVMRELVDNGINYVEYRKDVENEKSTATKNNFINDEIKVLVTVSSGLNIYKPDIRNIIHMCCPKDIESYYQEIGIGGRDGLPTRCIIFCPVMCYIYMEEIIAQTPHTINQRKILLKKLMKLFLMSKACRTLVLKRFDGIKISYVEPTPDCCDNCQYEFIKNDSSMYNKLGLNEYGKCNVKEDYILYIKELQKHQSKCSINFIASQLATAVSKSNYGCSFYKTERWWEGIGDLLTTKGYIENFVLQEHEISQPHGITLGLTLSESTATEIWETPNILMYKELLYQKTTINKSPPSITDGFHKGLLRKRLEFAKFCDCAPFTIASNETIRCLYIKKPKSLTALQELNLNAFNKRRIEIFGRDFLRLILEKIGCSWFIFCSKVKFATDFEVVRPRCMTLQTAYEMVATGIRNGFVLEWSKFGITDEMVQEVNYVTSKYEDMFLSTTPDWNASEDLKRFAALNMKTGQILLIWTYLQYFHELKLEFGKDRSMPSMAELLFKYPISVSVPNREWHLISLLNIYPIKRIAQIKDIAHKKIWESIMFAMMKGHEIKLSHFNIEQSVVKEIFFQVRSKKDFKTVPNYTDASEIYRATNYNSRKPNILHGHYLLAWAYLYTRIHLYNLNIDFYDFDPPNNDLKTLLLGQLHNKETNREA